MLRILPVFLAAGSLCAGWAGSADEGDERPPENVYAGELVSYPGPWAFSLGHSSVILVSDQELVDLSDPDKPINMSLGRHEQMESLRRVCESAQREGKRTLKVAFDHFFSQYRPGQGDKPRSLMPDSDEYIERIAAISKFAEGYGLGLELSLLSPLEIGPAYTKTTGESGVWMHYRKGLRDPETGAFSVQLWRQTRWVNNKGPIDIESAGVRVFAFREEAVHGTDFRVVDPESIEEITGVAEVEEWPGLSRGKESYSSYRVRVHGSGKTEIGDLNRVLVVQIYRTPEMDYFSDRALPYLKGLVDKYVDAGVNLNGLYSDEMHIQQDWGYFGHHDNGEFALRYVSEGLSKKFSEEYGGEFRDFAKYLVYFVRGQEDFANDLTAKSGVQHVFGSSPEDIRRTALFRSRYYRFLQNGVVDLFVEAKHYAEKKMGHRLEARAHPTWAQSPTIAKWDTGRENGNRNRYEYTSNFVWSNTVHEAAAACHDYFKWGDFLTGNGNDHAEGGWLDRNYLGLALACSTGILNEVPYSYGAHWGMPQEVSHRRNALVSAFGTAGSPLFGTVQDMQHRDVEVLMLYPLDLVSCDERFGSWMSQYAYANYVTQEKLLERGRVNGGAIEMAGRRFTTLVATFEPFPSSALLEMMEKLVEGGGRVVWSGPPPVLSHEGEPILEDWEEIFDARYDPGAEEGLRAPGKQVVFEGTLYGVEPQTILTDFLVDRIYPVYFDNGSEPVACVKDRIVGSHHPHESGGSATFLGFRPRDDQSRSLGDEARTWFEILNAIGAYPPTGKFGCTNDNTEYLSRTTDCLCCRFPNGAVAIAPHFREMEEDWPGGFARDEEEDKAVLEKIDLPSEDLQLCDFKANGHTIGYSGLGAVTFRVDAEGNLLSFAGSSCKEIAVDGKEWVFSDKEVHQLAWAPIPEERRADGGAVLQMMVSGTGEIRLPSAILPEEVEFFAEGPKPGSRGEAVSSSRKDTAVAVEVGNGQAGRWIYAVPK
jgi:hypothetical protein